MNGSFNKMIHPQGATNPTLKILITGPRNAVELMGKEAMTILDKAIGTLIPNRLLLGKTMTADPKMATVILEAIHPADPMRLALLMNYQEKLTEMAELGTAFLVTWTDLRGLPTQETAPETEGSQLALSFLRQTSALRESLSQRRREKKKRLKVNGSNGLPKQ